MLTMTSTFRALKNRNYRLYFYGQFVSVVGTGMQVMVQSWLVYRLSHSAVWLGAIMFFSQVPAFIMSPFAGTIVDRADRRKILIYVQTLAMLQAFALAALVFTGVVQIWHIAVLAIVLGVLNAFEITTRHAFAVDLVGKGDLSSAIALNSATINASRVLGPALAGVLIEPFGEGWCFALNGLSFIAVIIGLFVIQSTQTPRRETDKLNPLLHIGEAFRYVRSHPVIQPLILFAVIISFIGFPYSVLLPVFAQKTLGGGAQTFAWLSGAAGIGAVLGAVFSGAQVPIETVRPKVLTHMILMGAALVLLGISRDLWLSLIALVGIGYFMMGSFPVINTSIQHAVEDRMRGRVLGLYTMTFFGATPIGSLIAGWMADHIGAPSAAIIGGVLSVVVGAVSLAFGGRAAKLHA